MKMQTERIIINGIPAIVWGEQSEKVWLCVHGKMSSKESALGLAEIASQRGYQTIAFDLPQHGQRVDESDRCDIWNGIRDLTVVGEYVFDRWSEVCLYACSLGAFFSLHAYQNRRFARCLFQSPILDMEYLVGQMMTWFDITPQLLEREREIDTPIDLLSWDYYQYVRAHPVTEWASPTDILFGGRDNLQTLDIVRSFAEKNGCTVTFSENSDHPFMTEADIAIVVKWLSDNII